MGLSAILLLHFRKRRKCCCRCSTPHWDLRTLPPCSPGWARRRTGDHQTPAQGLEPAATIAGFALNPLTAPTVPQRSRVIAHLRDVLGEPTYESLARNGETMTTTQMATSAFDQIDQARTELNAVSK